VGQNATAAAFMLARGANAPLEPRARLASSAGIYLNMLNASYGRVYI
jgi:hypothetical protein